MKPHGRAAQAARHTPRSHNDMSARPCHTCYDADLRTIMCSDGVRRCGACCGHDDYDVETGEYRGALL